MLVPTGESPDTVALIVVSTVLVVVTAWLAALTRTVLRRPAELPVYQRLADGRLRFSWNVATRYAAATRPAAVPDRHRPFPRADHFPMGRPFGEIDPVVEPRSAARPFGLSLAVTPRAVATLDCTRFHCDEDLQLGFVREPGGLVPLSKHTDGTTNTVTDGGDGQTTNRDSDTDHRED